MSGASELVAAIDVGTSAVKAGIFDSNGRRRGYGTASAGARDPGAVRSEQPGELIWQATIDACRQALAAAGRTEVAAVAVTGARGSFALGDSAGRLLTDFITWQDRRAIRHADEAATLVDAVSFHRSTGVRMDASLWLPRLLWLIEHRSDAIAAADCIVTPQALVARRLGADGWPAEWSMAAYSGLFDIAARSWDPALVELFGVPGDLLPPTVPPGAEVGHVSAAAAEATGVSRRAPVVLAASDGPSAEIGCGVIEPGRLNCYLGTAVSVAGPVERRVEDRSQGLMTAPGSTPTRHRMLALGMAGASVLDWYGSLTGRPVLDRLEALVARSEPGARGALFIPALAGAGAPYWSPAARGAFIGLGFGHTEADLVRAMLEGVAFECLWMIEALRAFGFDPTGLRVTGGGSRSAAWTQLIADVVGTEIVVPDEPDPGLRGAAAYALARVGSYPDVLAAARAVAGAGSLRAPSPAATEVLRDRADLYLQVRRAFSNSGLDEALRPSKTGVRERPA